MHSHLSLFEGDRNAFYESGAEYQLSKVGRSFIAGLLRHAAEISAVTNQWVNSYKRIWGGTERTAGAGGEAPSYICWGHNNRSALVRVPMYKPGKTGSARVEVRSIDSGANPYLDLRRPPRRRPQGHRGGLRTPAGRRGRRLGSLRRRCAAPWASSPSPRTSARPSTLMERSDLVAETLGEHVFDFFLRNKRQEWEEYRSKVTAFELRKNLPVL
ncbi:Type I glutamate--ammonia ligase OS=Streptomyces fumanus OX=67302 GN=GCM10018772_00710 PE=3 SV=1 [Streptomyces fumanus]